MNAVNPFMPSVYKKALANSVDPDETPYDAAPGPKNVIEKGAGLDVKYWGLFEKASTYTAHAVVVAIKIIDQRKIKEVYTKENLHREPRILAQIRHPHIIRLYETLKRSGTNDQKLLSRVLIPCDVVYHLLAYSVCLITIDIGHSLNATRAFREDLNLVAEGCTARTRKS
ncbi:hypothetical protein DPMN_085175 [Dreissena polymorpha]|uniref:Protein kinase domain-containing protein n=1 Tax=Dreissena polymorpha TaxID=45954 RepID=A0A9D3YGD4_DREPO|nr:hypothetical protein DPMN_085175 [Dreissena polymorpha]